MEALNKLFAAMAAFVPQSIKDKIGADKVAHFCAGTFIGAVGLVLAIFFGGNMFWPVGLAAAVGALKEVMDYMANQKALKAGLPKPHGVEFLDFAYTAAGGLIGTIVFHLFF